MTAPTPTTVRRRRPACLRPAPGARAARRLARHGRRHAADHRVHRRQLHRRAAGRHLGGARRRRPGLPAAAGPPGERAAGGQRPVRRRRRGRHRRASPVRRATSSCSASCATPASRVVLLGSVALRRPLVGVRRRVPLARATWARWPRTRCRACARRAGPPAPRAGCTGRRDPATGAAAPDPEPERHWRDDPRLLRAYGWLTVLWARSSSLRAAVQGHLYRANEVRATARHRLAAARAAGHRRRGRGDPVGRRPGCTGTAAPTPAARPEERPAADAGRPASPRAPAPS